MRLSVAPSQVFSKAPLDRLSLVVKVVVAAAILEIFLNIISSPFAAMLGMLASCRVVGALVDDRNASKTATARSLTIRIHTDFSNANKQEKTRGVQRCIPAI